MTFEFKNQLKRKAWKITNSWNLLLKVKPILPLFQPSATAGESPTEGKKEENNNKKNSDTKEGHKTVMETSNARDLTTEKENKNKETKKSKTCNIL